MKYNKNNYWYHVEAHDTYHDYIATVFCRLMNMPFANADLYRDNPGENGNFYGPTSLAL
jgi:hypothetical protein